MSLFVYRALVWLYPRAFRDQYAADLIEAFQVRRDTMGPVRFWIFHLNDLTRSLAREHMDALRVARRRGKRRVGSDWFMSALVQDVRYAIRNFRKNTGFASIVITTLALGIGLNTAIFSVINGVLLRPLPYANSESLVWGFGTFSGGNNASVSPPDFQDYREQNTTFEYLAARRGAQSYAMTGLGAPEQVQGQTVTAGFFETLGGVPMVGRVFSREDETVATSNIVVLSHGFWQRAFGGESGIRERTLMLDGRSYEIVGVMPPGFRLFNTVDFWTPLPLDNEFNQIRRFHNLRLVGRLHEGVTIETAQAELDVIARQLEELYPASNSTWRLSITPLIEILVGPVRPALLVLCGAVAFVLLIACGNVANLLLARGATRQTEIALRAALGASRRRLLHQLFIENVTLGLLGGVLGLGIAVGGVKALQIMNPQNLPRLEQVGVDWVVLVFGLAVSVASALVFGLFPAVVAANANLRSTVSRGGRSGASSGSKVRAALVSIEVALALILLVGAGLLIRSFLQLTNVQPGFETDRLLVANISLPTARYASSEERSSFFETVQGRVEAMGGVQSAGWVDVPPLSGFGSDTYVAVPGRHVLGTESQFNAQTRSVSENYFDVMGIPLLTGREFNRGDRADGVAVVIIDEPFADAIFPDENPVGQQLQIDFGDVLEAEIVGVVGGVNQFTLAGARPLTFYLPGRQDPPRGNTLVVRTDIEPDALMGTIGSIVAEVDPLQPVADMTTAKDLFNRSVALPKFQMLLLGLFATVALTLAAVGIYGVLGYYVAQRRREVGLRMALGAKRRDVLRLIIGRALMYTSVGVVVGTAGAVAVTRLMSNLLFGVTATDPLTFVVVPLVLVVVACVASYIPAREALGVDPMTALRES